ncbi:MAG: hypothetical protein O7F12_07125 [Nitrospirae bacterium]|nr:hypothetical protein [Nitrospirota bacterium]
MAICQHIVTHHGGRIWVESAEAHGTVVHFTLHTHIIYGCFAPNCRFWKNGNFPQYS